MSRLVTNSAANLVAQLLQPALSILLVPFYIHFLGVEAFGLIVFFTTLVTVLGIFTKSIASSLQREVAIRSQRPSGDDLARLILTFETAYFALGISLAVLVAVALPLFGEDWIQSQYLPDNTIDRCTIVVALRLAVAFPASVYHAIFIGTERQVLGNMIYAGYVLASTILGAAVIYLYQSIVAFYIVDLIAAVASTLVYRSAVERILGPAVRQARFHWQEIRNLLSFSAGIAWTSSVGVLVTQFDRIEISRTLNLWSLAIYGTAAAGGQLVSLVSGAFLTAAYPQMCQAALEKSHTTLSGMLARNARIVSVLAATLSLPLIAFAHEALEIWTMKPNVAAEALEVMQVYVAGSIMLALASTVYQAQTALGISRYGVYFNTAALLWFPATVWLLVDRLGISGAAVAWCIYCFTSWLFNFAVVARMLMNTHSVLSYLTSISVIALVAATIGAAARLIANGYFEHSLPGRLTVVMAGMLLVLGACSRVAGLNLASIFSSLNPR